MYGAYSKPLILSFEFDLLWTKLTNIEANTEHLAAVTGVTEHVVDVHLFHQSVTGVPHVRRLLLEEVRPHTRHLYVTRSRVNVSEMLVKISCNKRL